jgi:hypothetical protein
MFTIIGDSGRRICDKARRNERYTPKRKTEPTPETVTAQKKRFIETAKELGADETGEAFERAFKKAVPPAKVRDSR